MNANAESVRTLEGLISHYSPSGEEAAVVSWLVDRMRTLGFTAAFRDQAGNAVGVIGTGAKNAVLLGHIDTVRGDLPLRMDKERIYGRGTVDAKGSLACFVSAAAAVSPASDWRLTVIGAVDEERGSAGARYAAEAYQADFVIVGEPNRWDRIGLGYKGTLPMRLSLRRPASHTASAAITAAEEWVQCWNSIYRFAGEYNADKPKLFDQLLVSLRSLQAGEDQEGQFASGEIGCRLPPEGTPGEWFEKLQKLVSAGELEKTAVPIPSWRCEKNTALVRAFMKAIRAQEGTPAFVYKTGTADLNIVAPAWGCPALVYGPGDSALDHTAGEYLEIAEYLKAIEVLKDALNQLITAG